MCDEGDPDYDIIDLKFEQYGRIGICEDCFENLVSDGRSQRCTLCFRGARFGTWQLTTYRTLNQPNPKKLKHEAEHFLFCEEHFRELENHCRSRLHQTKIRAFKKDEGYLGYLDNQDLLLPMRRRLNTDDIDRAGN
jgi:hypothetical protein